MQYLRLLALFFCCALAVAACGSGGGGGTEISVSDVGNVEGTVTDASTGTALSGVTVQVGDKSDVTGDNGVYSIQDIDVGSRTITATITGYQSYSGTVTITKGTTVSHNIEMTATGTTPDTTPPTVSSTSPASSATGVAVNSAISVTFSETVDCSTITTSSFILIDSSSNAVAGTITTCNNASAVFTPSSNLSYSTSYTTTITSGVKDAAGNAMASNYSWSFTTGAQPTTAPSSPTGVSATAGNSQVTISWGSVSGATSYNLYWSTTTGVTKTSGTKISNTTSPYIQTGLTNGTTHYYVVTAVNSYGESGESSEVSAIPTVPPAPTLISISITPATNMANGTTKQFTATGSYSDSTTSDISTSVTWNSSDTGVATVSSEGVVTSVGIGTTTIAATELTSGLSAESTVIVNNTSLIGGSMQGNPLSLTNTVTTIAGSAGISGSTDGTGTAARFYKPEGMTTDGINLFLTDQANHTIRKIVIATGEVTTLAGFPGIAGSNDGTGSTARFNTPENITTDGTNLYVADTGNNTIRKVVMATAVVTTIAGSAGSSGSTDGTGSAARFYGPRGITTDGINLFVSDTENDTIRKVVLSTGVVTTIAGAAGSPGSIDGTGSAARLDGPEGITTDGTNLYVAEDANNTIRKIVIATGVVTTVIGLDSRFITTDGTNLYVSDLWNNVIRKIVISTGTATDIAGSSGISGSNDGIGSAAKFYYPAGLATDGTNLYIADHYNHTIRKIQ